MKIGGESQTRSQRSNLPDFRGDDVGDGDDGDGGGGDGGGDGDDGGDGSDSGEGASITSRRSKPNLISNFLNSRRMTSVAQASTCEISVFL